MFSMTFVIFSATEKVSLIDLEFPEKRDTLLYMSYLSNIMYKIMNLPPGDYNRRSIISCLEYLMVCHQIIVQGSGNMFLNNFSSLCTCDSLKFHRFLKCKDNSVGPGLAQLVEHLTHRYSESTSSNPGNLTSEKVCGDRTGSDASHQEVGMCSTRGGSRECIHYICLCKKRIRKNPLWL